MRGWRIIPDRAGYDEVTLTKLGQAVTIGRHYCDIAIPNEHTHVSRTHAVVLALGRAHEERHTCHVRTARAGCI